MQIALAEEADLRRAYIPCEYDAPIGFYFGVIDMLQRWNWNKKAEQMAKRTLRCVDKKGNAQENGACGRCHRVSPVASKLVSNVDVEHFVISMDFIILLPLPLLFPSLAHSLFNLLLTP
jgi:hypothetical protein